MADFQRRAAGRHERRDPMGDEAAESALLFLNQHAQEAGVAKAHMIYMEHFRKVTLARLRREAPEKTEAGRDNWARAHPEYAEVLKAQTEAVAAYEVMLWRRIQAEATIEAWRTRAANQLGPLDALRREVAIMYQHLDDHEWADHLATTAYGQCLETAISRLVGENTELRAQLARQGQGEAALYEMRLVAPNGHAGQWHACDKESFEKFKSNPDVGDGFKYGVRALYDHPAPASAQPDRGAAPEHRDLAGLNQFIDLYCDGDSRLIACAEAAWYRCMALNYPTGAAPHSQPVRGVPDHDQALKLAEQAGFQNLGGFIMPPRTNGHITTEVVKLVQLAAAPSPAAQPVAPPAPTYWNSQRKMISRAIIGLRDGWATRKDADDALAVLEAVAPAQGAQVGGQWISVEDERKPEARKPVLLFVHTLTRGYDDEGRPHETEGAEVAMGEYRHGASSQMSYFDCYTSPMSDNDWITHWMPLPATPGKQPHSTTTEGADGMGGQS